jgi:multiple sugar transport system ATP-binding protein
MTMADKIVVMHDGIVEQIGAPLELYDRPVNLFVAGFIGSPAMNVLEGRIDGSGFVMGDLVLPIGNAPAASSGRPAYYGIRPEHFKLTGEEGLPIEVIVTEPTGSETQVVANVGGREITCVFRERISASPGEIIHVTPERDQVHLFDKETGRRLN